MAEYNKKTQEQTDNQLESGKISAAPLTLGLSPEVFAKKIGSVADIKNDITLTVVASGQDIKDAKQFKAIEIFISPAPKAANKAIIEPIK